MKFALSKVIAAAKANGWKATDAPVQSISLKRIVDHQREHQVLVFFAWGGVKLDFVLIYPSGQSTYRTQVLDDLLADLERLGDRS